MAGQQQGINTATAGQNLGFSQLTAAQQEQLNAATAAANLGYSTGIAGLQNTYNIGAQAGSQYDHLNPYGNLNYVQTGTGPNGVPIYSAQETLSPVEQKFIQYLYRNTANCGSAGV